MLPMDFCSIYPPANREERALALLKRVGLEGLAHKLPAAVAGGQQQSAAVARALANDPPILVADEPTGNLDSHTASQVMGIFEDLVAQGKTVVMVTHDRTLAARTSRILLIRDGELAEESAPRTSTPAMLAGES
jgi:putative ABC transport system ATP-binding protein